MKRDYKLYINDIRESVALIEEYIKDTSEKEFIKNKQVPWFKMSQFRDLVIHSYFSTSLDRIWVAAAIDLKTIKEGMKKILLV